MLVRSGAVDVVAIDSVAALTPRAELEGQMGDQSVGMQARMMSQAMRKLAGNLNRTQTLCILTNQIREKIGVMFGSPETQPGGRALKFYASQRLDIRRIETLKDGNEAVGNRVRVKVVKNKVAAPFRQAEFDIEFGKGISTAGCLIDLGIEHSIVTKSGSFFSYGEDRLGQGRNNAKAYLEEHPELATEIEQRIYAAVGVSKSLVLPIEHVDGEEIDDKSPIDFEKAAAAITIADERAAARGGFRRAAAGRRGRGRVARGCAAAPSGAFARGGARRRARALLPTPRRARAQRRGAEAQTRARPAWRRGDRRCDRDRHAAGPSRRCALRAAARRGPPKHRRMGRRADPSAAAGRRHRAGADRLGARRSRRAVRARGSRRAAAAALSRPAAR
jgi:hypothetical protein